MQVPSSFHASFMMDCCCLHTLDCCYADIDKPQLDRAAYACTASQVNTFDALAGLLRSAHHAILQGVALPARRRQLQPCHLAQGASLQGKVMASHLSTWRTGKAYGLTSQLTLAMAGAVLLIVADQKQCTKDH